MLDRMSSREFTEWLAYYELEPFGEQRADLRAALIASVIANAHRDPKKKPYKAADFLLFPEKTEPTSEDLRSKFVSLTSNMRPNEPASID